MLARHDLAWLARLGCSHRRDCRRDRHQARGTRHVARTSLMSGARLVLIVILIIVVYLAYRARSGG
jgi:hypothetical protein